jgi:hypothetical protein
VQHDRRLAEAEVASPADQVSRQGRDQLRHADTGIPKVTACKAKV